MLTLNFQVTMAATVRTVFHLESDAYGSVSSVFAVGSLSGALWAARRRNPRPRTVVLAALFMLTGQPLAGAVVLGLAGRDRDTGAEAEARRLAADFPILQRDLAGQRLVYLDSGATSQRPRSVLEAGQVVRAEVMAPKCRSAVRVPMLLI